MMKKLCATALCFAGLVGCKASHTLGGSATSGTSSATLPFNPLDPNATFGATLLIEARDGTHPSASLAYGGKTYTTDTSGKIVIPSVKAADQSTGLRITAAGYLARSVTLDYRRVTGTGMRVVLETPGIVTTFSADNPTSIAQGPMTIGFAPSSFRSASGQAYTGTVHVAALGIDPVASVVTMDQNGFSLRPDFDVDRIPQGYGLASGTDGTAHFLLPESLFQVQLTDDSGAALTLSKPATTSFTLSSLTFHRPGDVLPQYTFDESLQHWVASNTCTVTRQSDNSLACIGSTPHFSSWMIASGADETHPSCGNLQFRVQADSKYDPNPQSITVMGVQGRDAIDSSAGMAPDSSSTSGACFYQRTKFAYVSLQIVLTRKDGTGNDTFDYVLGKSNNSMTSNFDSNVQLVQGPALKSADLTTAKLDVDCAGCPATIVDIDLTSATAAPTPSVDGGTSSTMSSGCATITCAAGAKCIGEGTCSCPTGQEYDTTKGCVASKCPTSFHWSDDAQSCVADPCLNNGGCDVHATCTAVGQDARTCTCNAGYFGGGFACTVEGGGADMATVDMAAVDMATVDMGAPNPSMSPDPSPSMSPDPSVPPATCTDGIQNQGETDVDCGGANCSACADGKMCLQPSDCTSLVCSTTCQAATCTDGVQNEGESSIDCGGANCPACTVGNACSGSSDCSSQNCVSSVCEPTANGSPCVYTADCSSGFCSSNVCAACSGDPDCGVGMTCSSGICVPGGGGACGGMAPSGQLCLSDMDCLSCVCLNNTGMGGTCQ